MRNDAKGSPPIGLWALALGAVGFACGFFGPVSLNQGANQGPLLESTCDVLERLAVHLASNLGGSLAIHCFASACMSG
jgi:hypothetical protein